MSHTSGSLDAMGPGRRMRRAFACAFAVLFAMLAAWAFSDPLMAGPDEPAHTVKAAGVAQGDLAGTPDPEVGGVRYVTVPAWADQVATLGRCFAFKPAQAGDCAPALDDESTELISSGTGAGTYNPVYYALVGWPSLFLRNEAGIIGMRLAASALTAAVLASGFAALAGRRRSTWSLLAGGLSMTPMVLFIGSHINVSGLEIAAGFAVACWFALLVEEDRRVSIATASWGVAITAALLANTRSVGPMWLAAIAVAMLLDRRIWPQLLRSRSFWGAFAALAAAGAFAAWWALSMGSDEVRDPGAGAGETPFSRGAEFMLSKTLESAAGYIGELGWRDAPLPPTLVAIWGGLMFALVVGAIIAGRSWPRIRVIALLLAFIALPALVQGASWNTHGYIWQSRYVLAVLLALLVCAGAALDDSVPPLHALPRGPLVARAVAGTVWILGVFAMAWNLRRYVTGINEPGVAWSEMVTDPRWQPPGGWPLVLCLDAVAFGIGLVALLRWGGRWTDAADAPAAWPRGAKPPRGDDLDADADDRAREDGARDEPADDPEFEPTADVDEHGETPSPAVAAVAGGPDADGAQAPSTTSR